MCGICGLLHLDPSKTVDENLLRDMADTINHRGPDSEGYFFDDNLGLGHKRLKIIDLSPAGNQPMTNENQRYWIVFNGEIYNYIELRQELLGRGHELHSHSDTEVILHLYEDYGPNCVELLNGMFSFAIWDKQDRTLFCARDRLGIKPFYYVFENGTFAFASEIKALLGGKFFAPEINPAGLADYLTFQFCLEDKTLFQKVSKLLPGHWLRLTQDGELSIQKYWSLEFEVQQDHDQDFFEHQLLRVLEDAIRIRLRADVPVGAHLSGGLDSSVVTSLAASLLNNPIHSFSGGFKGGPQYDETQYARIVAENANTIHHEVFPTDKEFVELLPKLIYHMDEPAAGPGLFPQYMVSALARDKVKVVLGGQGGDELFGGYTRYLVAYLEECIRGGIQGTTEEENYVVSFASILPNLSQLRGYEPMLRNFWTEGLFDTQESRYFRLVDRSKTVRGLFKLDALDALTDYSTYETYREIFNRGDIRSYINKMTAFDLNTLLPALLHVEDRTSMAVSLESRVPLLDHRIVELVGAMPPKVKYEGGRSKHIFRKATRHVVPKEIHERSDKMGFPVPLSEWYQKGEVRDFVLDSLLGSTARNRGYFDADQVEALLNGERPYGRGVWGLLSLELWFETFIDG